MHDEILSDKQKELLNLLKKFAASFGLVGGTAAALQIGHRRSIDFDLATLDSLNTEKIRSEVREDYKIESTLVDEANELSIVVNSVKLTFFKYPFSITFGKQLNDIINIPDILTLASMKAYALGRRAKWKDYVDLYFILKQYSIYDLIKKSRKIFKNEFNEKLFREQLSYFEDIDYTEKIDYMEGFYTDDKIIKEALIEIGLQRK
jgi:hypothetical protein